MATVIWAPAAVDDVNQIAEFIARDSRDHATLFVERLIEATSRLQSFPYSGRIIPEIGDGLRREIIYGAYRIMYRIKNDEIWIT